MSFCLCGVWILWGFSFLQPEALNNSSFITYVSFTTQSCGKTQVISAQLFGFFWGTLGFISETVCITQSQISYSICVNCWLKTISLLTLQMTAVFPTSCFLLLALSRISLQQRLQTLHMHVARKRAMQRQLIFFQKPGEGRNQVRDQSVAPHELTQPVK